MGGAVVGEIRDKAISTQVSGSRILMLLKANLFYTLSNLRNPQL